MTNIEQVIISPENNYEQLDEWIKISSEHSLFLVCDHSIKYLKLDEYFSLLPKRIGIKVIRYSDFQPNPSYESVVKAVKKFKKSGAKSIIAVGGGSTIDVAKCIKLYSNMDESRNYMEQEIVSNKINFLAIPTTAGTGSEATRYAVIYYNGEKQSITHDSCIPETVLMDPSLLKTLPLYQKKSTMMDALCHAVEAFWSINSTNESKVYSKEAIIRILTNMDGYLSGKDESYANMLMASHIAGKAINITQTTAGHAMCYKLTSLYGISHGHASAICVSQLWPWMEENINKCIDIRGEDYVKGTFEELRKVMKYKNLAKKSGNFFSNLVEYLKLDRPKAVRNDIELLANSINLTRLRNNPVQLDKQDIKDLYRKIVIIE